MVAAKSAAVIEKTAGEKAALSREINRLIDLDAQVKALTGELKEARGKVFGLVGETPGLYQSNRGFVEIQRNSVLSIPKKSRAGLKKTLGVRYEEVVEEEVSVKVTDRLRNLLFSPNPADKALSDALRDHVTVRETVSFRIRGAN